jgi:hypothetical protein
MFTLTVDDGHGGRASDRVFINVPDIEAFIGVGIESPRSGATLTRGTPVVIRWGATDGAFRRFDLWVSPNGGRSWGLITGCTAMPASARQCTWANPGPASDDTRLRIVGFARSGEQWVSVTGQMRIR